MRNYDIELLYRAGRDHGNADKMPHLPDMVELCRGYKAGIKIEELPCVGCRFCSTFLSDVLRKQRSLEWTRIGQGTWTLNKW